jgi:hypothetical protein
MGTSLERTLLMANPDPAVGQTWIYKGAGNAKAYNTLVNGETYVVRAIRGKNIWMHNTREDPDNNFDWQGSMNDLKSPARWDWIS